MTKAIPCSLGVHNPSGEKRVCYEGKAYSSEAKGGEVGEGG